MFSGGALEHMSVFALGIMPYISASIILDLLTVVIPYLDKLKKEGEAGRKKITQYARYGTVVLSLFQGLGIAVGMENMSGPGGASRGYRTRLGFSFDDHDHPDFRYGLYHVAGGTDHRTGDRKRHLPDHLCRHRGPHAHRPGQHLAIGADRAR